ncbi:serine/threonine protein kinase [Candidatus Uabimicrobium amorphum]|uniref:Protein kinase n=1 Tax=Uabimicrobium amorphum TaxID=2596890 RepID=A0A5S9IS34_UABAM|nr:serine/threonine-protein kinase [Candidatus Uabimicrobium amorphum]BBM86511.1 protein kinase [Candidatus Uabimicrobium amorphum]
MELYILSHCRFADKALLQKAWNFYQQQQMTMPFIDFLLSKNIIDREQHKLMLSVRSILQNKSLEPKYLAHYVEKYLQLRPQMSLHDWLAKQQVIDHSPTKEITTPPQVGRYKIVSKIGSGGMGDVFKAFDPYIKRYVAIKTMHCNRSSQRFLREIEACGKLNHPHIVNIFDCGQQENICYFVMDFIEGQTLHEKIASGITIEETLSLIEKIARALGYAHRMGIIHRDIKAKNILVDRDGEPRIVDFGLVKMQHVDELTRQNQIVGSIYYMSPEQIDSGLGEISPQTDIYSLGVVMYHALSGMLPFSGNSQVEVMNLIVNSPTPLLSDVKNDIKSQVEKVCRKAMAKEIGNRYGSAEEFAASIANLKSTPRSSRVKRSPHVPAKKQALVALLVLVLLMCSFFIFTMSTSKITFPTISYKNVAILKEEPYFLTAKDRITIRNHSQSYIYFFARKNGKIFTLDQYFVSPQTQELQILAKEVNYHEDWLLLPSHNKLSIDKIERVISSFASRGIKTKKIGSYTPQQKISWRIYGIGEDFTQTLLGSFSISPEPFLVDFFVRGKQQPLFQPLSKIEYVTEGDQLQLRIFAHKKNDYLSIFFKDSKGEVGYLFPEEGSVTRPFASYSKNKNMIYIPDKYQGFEFDHHAGKEHIIVFFQETPIDNERIVAWLHNVSIPLSPQNELSLSKLCSDFKIITITHKTSEQ